MRARYHINLFWSEYDDCWIADVPDLVYGSAHGQAADTAVAQLETAVASWLAVQAEAGRPAPAPRFRPAIYAARDAA